MPYKKSKMTQFVQKSCANRLTIRCNGARNTMRASEECISRQDTKYCVKICSNKNNFSYICGAFINTRRTQGNTTSDIAIKTKHYEKIFTTTCPIHGNDRSADTMPGTNRERMVFRCNTEVGLHFCRHKRHTIRLPQQNEDLRRMVWQAHKYGQTTSSGQWHNHRHRCHWHRHTLQAQLLHPFPGMAKHRRGNTSGS